MSRTYRHILATGMKHFSKRSFSHHNKHPEDKFTPILVSIEGNIGAGKTTLLKKLRELHPEWISIDEPVDTWATIKNEQNESILEVFYKDRHRWSYTFQNCALLTRYQNIEGSVTQARRHRMHGKHIFLTERCLDTDYHVFTQMLRAEGSIDKIEAQLYERLLVELKKHSTPLSAIIHVNTQPPTCADRIKARGRSGEEAISMDYLERLSSYQTNWINTTDCPTYICESTDIHGVEQFITDLLKE